MMEKRGKVEMHTTFWFGNLKIRGHTGIFGLDERIYQNV
jgi:hypothetical protein